MSFLLASSFHRPDADSQEPEEMNAPPIPRSGGVRATSHLPAAGTGQSHLFQPASGHESQEWVQDMLKQLQEKITKSPVPSWKFAEQVPSMPQSWPEQETSPEDTMPWHPETPDSSGGRQPADGSSAQNLPQTYPGKIRGQQWQLPGGPSAQNLPQTYPGKTRGRQWQLPGSRSAEKLPWKYPSMGGAPGMLPRDAAEAVPLPWHGPDHEPHMPSTPGYGLAPHDSEDLPPMRPRTQRGSRRFPSPNPWLHDGSDSSRVPISTGGGPR